MPPRGRSKYFFAMVHLRKLYSWSLAYHVPIAGTESLHPTGYSLLSSSEELVTHNSFVVSVILTTLRGEQRKDTSWHKTHCRRLQLSERPTAGRYPQWFSVGCRALALPGCGQPLRDITPCASQQSIYELVLFGLSHLLCCVISG